MKSRNIERSGNDCIRADDASRWILEREMVAGGQAFRHNETRKSSPEGPVGQELLLQMGRRMGGLRVAHADAGERSQETGEKVGRLLRIRLDGRQHHKKREDRIREGRSMKEKKWFTLTTSSMNTVQ